MLDVPLLISTGFSDESFGKGTHFMRRDLQDVGNLTIHAKTFVTCYDGKKVKAWQVFNVYVTAGNRHLFERRFSQRKRNFTSTQEALSALGFQELAMNTKHRVTSMTSCDKGHLVCIHFEDGQREHRSPEVVRRCDIRIGDVLDYNPQTRSLCLCLEQRPPEAAPYPA